MLAGASPRQPLPHCFPFARGSGAAPINAGVRSIHRARGWSEWASCSSSIRLSRVVVAASWRGQPELVVRLTSRRTARPSRGADLNSPARVSTPTSRRPELHGHRAQLARDELRPVRLSKTCGARMQGTWQQKMDEIAGSMANQCAAADGAEPLKPPLLDWRGRQTRRVAAALRRPGTGSAAEDDRERRAAERQAAERN